MSESEMASKFFPDRATAKYMARAWNARNGGFNDKAVAEQAGTGWVVAIYGWMIIEYLDGETTPAGRCGQVGWMGGEYDR